jgi:hypothetical protein
LIPAFEGSNPSSPAITIKIADRQAARVRLQSHALAACSPSARLLTIAF